MKNQELAGVFMEIADLLRLTGQDDRFRINAYERAARVIETHAQPIDQMATANTLHDLPGIGKHIEEKIREFLASGTVAYRDELKSTVPPGLLEMLNISGLGPKKAKHLYDALGIDSIEGLKKAAQDGRIRSLDGFGSKSEENILKGIALYEKAGSRPLLFDALRLAREIIATLEKAAPAIQKISMAGSLRRGTETIGDIDLLCAVKPGHEAAVTTAFTELPLVTRVIASGETKTSVLINNRMQVDLRIVPLASFGAALQYFTGSKEHNVELRKQARLAGYLLNEYGLFTAGKQEKLVAAATEEQVYEALGFSYIPPELRENRGELEAARKHALPALLELPQVKGDMHVHSRYSDGVNTIAELGAEAKARGYEWLICTDHSRSLKIANGLSIERLRDKIDEIRRYNDQGHGVTILAGTEVDILQDGSLDYPDDVLAELDFVIASIHSGFKETAHQLTSRICSAMRNQYVDCVGHLTGRLLGQREAYEIDWQQIVTTARETGTMLEINASPQRLDLTDIACRQAKEQGILLAIGTDAHTADQLDYLELGITVARRGWLSANDGLNTRTLKELKKIIS